MKGGTAMSFIWMIAAGLLAGCIAKPLLPRQSAGGIFILGFGGAVIAGVMEYSVRLPIGFIGPLTGAAVLLAIYAATLRTPAVEKTSRDDLRKAA
jgi:uncharacterized membrane protein YeaQ/YmgE (transglycosylase-associated protein family)